MEAWQRCSYLIGDGAKMGIHPRRRVAQVGQQSFPILCRKNRAQSVNARGCDVRFAEIAKGGNNQTARATGRSHVAWRDLAQLDEQTPQLYFSRPSAGQEHHFGRHLFRKSEKIGCIGTGRLQLHLFVSSEGLGNSFNGGSHFTQQFVRLRVVVEPTSDSADGAKFGQSMQGKIDCPPATQV